MALSDYYDLQDTVARWLERYDVTEYIPDLISAAETRIADDIKLRAMETSLSTTLSSGSNSISIPTGFLHFKGTVFLVDDGVREPLTQRTEDWVKAKYPEDTEDKPSDFYLDASNIVFNCTADADYTITGTYYKKLSLGDDNLSNWILENYPYVLVYGTLIEAMIFLEDDPRRFEAMYMEQLDRMRRAENRAKGAAGPRVWRQCSLDGWQGSSYRGKGVDGLT